MRASYRLRLRIASVMVILVMARRSTITLSPARLAGAEGVVRPRAGVACARVYGRDAASR